MKRIIITVLVVVGLVAIALIGIAAKRVQLDSEHKRDTQEAMTQLNTLLVGRFGQDQLASMVTTGAYKFDSASKPKSTFIFQYTVNDVHYVSVVADGQWIELARKIESDPVPQETSEDQHTQGNSE